MAIQKYKQHARVTLYNPKTGKVVLVQEDSSSNVQAYGAYLRVPVPPKEGTEREYFLKIERLDDVQFRVPYEKRLAARQTSEEARKKREEEREAQALVLRRARIMNQIDHAFEKKGKDAVKFVTCDECDDVATHLGLTHHNPGSQVIAPEQITTAACEGHYWPASRPYKTTAWVECAILEFFYDGVKQIYINKP